MAKTKADLERRIATLEAMMRKLIASHKAYTEWQSAGTNSVPSLEWALEIERAVANVLNTRG